LFGPLTPTALLRDGYAGSEEVTASEFKFLATDSTSRARVWTTSNVDEEGSLAVLAMAGVAGKDVVVDEGGAAAGNDVALLVLALLVLTEE